jgi:WD40 repeat protein/transcriptional regulator with XRE-family HTH domain
VAGGSFSDSPDGPAHQSGDPAGAHRADPARVRTAGDFGRELTLLRRAAGLTVRQLARRAGLPHSTAGDYVAGRHLPPPAQPVVLRRILRACGVTDEQELDSWQAAADRARRGPGRSPGLARDADPADPAGRVTGAGPARAAGDAGAGWAGAGQGGGAGQPGAGQPGVLRAGGSPAAAGPDGARSAADSSLPSRRGSVIPYRGLASFQAADAQWFFGREDLTARLVQLAGAARAAGQPLMVVGPSGSGKSSLLRAGLIPAIEHGSGPGIEAGRAPALLLTPGARPITALAAELLAAARRGSRAAPGSDVLPGRGAGPGQDPDPDPGRAATVAGLAARLLAAPDRAADMLGPADRPGPGAVAGSVAAVVIDQFEQVFTACPDEAERQAFITAAGALASRVLVVVGLRADCYGRALRYAGLAAALQERQLAVGPMSADQLRRVISEPARRAGVSVTEGLVELLLRDLTPRFAGPGGQEAGALPLLSHALRATWEHGRGGTLTVADYRASGGITDAIARTAEDAYGALRPAEQRRARWLFLRLVQVADDSIETRCQVPLAELGELAGDGTDGGGTGVLSRFIDERLITVTAAAAEITHDALLHAWPRLREWIEGDRDGLRTRRRVTDAARTWADSGHDSAVLLRGGQLAIARDWAAVQHSRDGLSKAARQFLAASAAHEQATVEAERRRSRRLTRLVAALAVLVLATVGLAGYAFSQRRAAMTEQLIADSRELAVEASQLRGQDPSVAAQLSLAAYRTARTPAALGSLLESSGTPAATRLRDSAGVVEAMALSTSRHLLAVVAADGTVRLWNVARPGAPVPASPRLTAGPGSLFAVAFSPDGRTLAVAGTSKVVRLWNVSRPGHPVPDKSPLTGPRKTIYGLSFSPAGTILAAASADGTVRLWAAPGTAGASARPLATLAGPGGYVQAVAFSPDGQRLAAGTTSGQVALWDVASPRRPAAAGAPLTGPARSVTSVAFSPGGRTLAAGSQDDEVWLWRLTRPGGRQGGSRPAARRLAPLPGATDWVNTVAFSPDGTALAAGSSDGSVRLWNLGTGRLTGTLRHPDVVTSLAFDGGHELISGCADGTVRLWPLPPPVLAAAGEVNSVAYAPRGGLLAAGSQDLELWNPVTRTEQASAAVAGTFVNAVAYARPSGLLAAGYGNGRVQLWDTAGGRLTRLGPLLSAPSARVVESVTFSPDGKILASGSDDGSVRLWNVTDPARPELIARIPDSAAMVFGVAFAPGGRLLAAASSDDVTRLWDVANPARPARAGPALRGTASYDLSVAFSPDGRTLAVGSADKTVHLWDVARPAQPRLAARPLRGPEGYVYALAFSPDGQTLAAAVTDNTVWLWQAGDAGHPALAAQLTGPAGHVYTVAFSPSGGQLAAGSADGTVRLWDTGEHAAARSVCAAAGEPLTRSEWVSYDPGRAYQPPCPAREHG